MFLILNDQVKVTRTIAATSLCIRRRYGCLITDGVESAITNNLRVSRCCNSFCVREIAGLKHGEAVDLGAEIHAEQAALIKWRFPIDKHTKILIQGYQGKTDDLLYEENLYPCHTCALMIKYAGFKSVYITNRLEEIYPVSIDEIISYREQAWESYLIDV